MQQEQTPAILAGLSSPALSREETSTDESLAELALLLETAGGVAVGSVLQRRDSPDPRLFVGSGKAEEIGALAKANDAKLVVFDNELSPSQLKNLEDALDMRVLDRPGLILDIFAGRARTREGRLQVELAQLEYLLPRLTGRGIEMSRQGSGVGTHRGPGETKLENDRRHIRNRIARLRAELSEVRRHRAEERRGRARTGLPSATLIGYTNAGKSSLLGALADGDVVGQDRLFDTLDPTTRVMSVDEGLSILLTDTVGFIRKLPHQLVEAFKATLEELALSDLLLHVIDASSPNWEEQAAVVDRLVEAVGAQQVPCLRVFNKWDKVEDEPAGAGLLRVSAKTGAGLPLLRAAISRELDLGRAVNLLLPYDAAGLLDTLHANARVHNADYTPEGIAVRATVPAALLPRLLSYVQ